MDYQHTTETVLREEIAMLREQQERVYQTLGRLEEELRRREGEYIAHKADRLLEERAAADHE
jgi:hypothetical protein